MCMAVIRRAAFWRTIGAALSKCVAEGLCSGRSGGGCSRSAQVKGKRLDSDSGIRTRSRAATQHEQYEAVPAPVQIFVLLADMLIEAREGARPEYNLICSCLSSSRHGKLPGRTVAGGRATRLSPDPGSLCMAACAAAHVQFTWHKINLLYLGFAQICRQCPECACFKYSWLHAGNLNGGPGGQDDSSSDWEELSEEGSESALEVHGLPPGQNLLDIAAATASAHDYVDGISKVYNLAP